MTDSLPPLQLREPTPGLRTIIKSQYLASLAMMREAIEKCPDDLWLDKARYPNACWQIAYHALFIGHLYLSDTMDSFRPWRGHRPDAQHPDGLPGTADPDSDLPLLPEPYTRDEALELCGVCEDTVVGAVDGFDLKSDASGFDWYKLSKLEHQFIAIRHIQHHAAQLIDRLRSECDTGVGWAGSRRKQLEE